MFKSPHKKCEVSAVRNREGIIAARGSFRIYSHSAKRVLCLTQVSVNVIFGLSKSQLIVLAVSQSLCVNDV